MIENKAGPGTMLKGGIKRRITITILVAASVILFLSISLTYFMGLDLLSNTLGTQYVQSARRLGSFIMENIKGELEDSSVYTKLPLWVDAVKDVNLKYKNMSPDDIVPYLKSMDKKWTSAKPTDPMLWEYLNNRVSVSMRDIAETRSGIVEMFITDKYGGLVSASSKTTDFYQADEEWWQRAYNGGKGGTYVSDIEFDESSGEQVIAIALPMKDESGNIVGICKNCLSLKRLFSDIGVYSMGNTGRAFLVNEEGAIVFPSGVARFDKKLFSEEEMNKLFYGKRRFLFMYNKSLSDNKLFAAFSSIKPPITQKKDAMWTVFVVQEAMEMSLPLNRFVTQLGFITICLMMFMVPMGLFFGERIVKPIRKLREATERFMSGDWDNQVEVRTGDEIEQFANIFRNMLNDIKDKQAKLENFSHELEERVRERTRKLSESQEATLNILEDLAQAKVELERSNKDLKKLDQLKSDFVSTVSHELRTPLSIIKEGVSLVIDKIPGDINEKQNKILEISRFNIDRLARIIDSLLDISKIEAGKVELNRSLISMSDIVKQVAASFELKAREKGLELKVDIEKDTGKVYADTDRITQVLVNLIGNSMKFTPSGYIKISCRSSADSVVCSVKDTGVGIAKDDLPKIFDKFQQFGRLAGAGEKGTGLGLSIAKGIIDMHNGSISVESEPGKGSMFTFVLHRYTEQSLFKEIAARAAELAARSKFKLSVVAVSVRPKAAGPDAALAKEINAVVYDCAKLIRNTLRRRGDDIINNNGDMLVVLMDCSKDNCHIIAQRLGHMLVKHLDEKKLEDRFIIEAGCATFPDECDTGEKLVETASSRMGAVAPAKK